MKPTSNLSPTERVCVGASLLSALLGVVAVAALAAADSDLFTPTPSERTPT